MTGVAVAAHDAVLARGAAVLRSLSILLSGSFLAIWGSWYGRHPGPLAVAVLALGWAGAFVAVSRHHQRLPGWLAAADVVIVLGLASASAPLVPRQTVGDAANWVYAQIGAMIIIVACTRSPRIWVPVTVATCAAYWICSAQVGATGPAPGAPARSVTLIALISIFPAVTIDLVRRRAVATDSRLLLLSRERQVAAVSEARARDGREQERLLHDTVLNTLTGIAWGAAGSSDGDSDRAEAVRRRCAADIGVIQRFLADEPDYSPADLVQHLARVVEVARAGGLDVTMREDVRIDTMDDSGAVAPTASPPGATVPAVVAAAVAAAVGEALANVQRHAGTTTAKITVRADGQGGGEVRVRDEGRGFDPATVRPDQLGLRRSVLERMIDAGGAATVVSAFGRGTTVTLRWSA